MFPTDGDSIIVSGNSDQITIRLVGIDVPETSKKKKRNGGFKRMQRWWIDVRMLKKLTDTRTEEFISGFENLPF